jgi:gluconate 2-dehydrogenase alpha chain
VTDVLLVGLGGANGVVADVLTRAGLEVVALEAGPRRTAAEMTLDELRNDVRQWLCETKAQGELPTWRATPDGEAGPSPHPMLMVNAVGGSTVHYPGLSARFHAWNFAPRSATVARYGAGALPAGTTLADWPLDYPELEPFYDAVEQAIGVAGQAGRVAGERFAGGSVHEEERSRPYPLPPLRRTGWTELTAGAAAALGWHPFPAPAAINSVPFNGNPECTYCGFCTDNGCWRGAKGSADATVIRRAEAGGRLRIETGARVMRIESGPDGLVTGATFVQEGRERFCPARAVVLGAFTYENTRLLLLSRSRSHPHGLANGSDQVGRHYMAHVTPFAFGRFPGRRLNLFTGLWAQATCVDDWNADNFDHTDLGFVGGGLLAASHEHKPIAFAGFPLPPGVPRIGSGWKACLAANAQSVGAVSAQMECLPYEEHRLDLDPVARDPHGVPVVRVTFRPRENEVRGAAFLAERQAEWLRAAGADEVWHAPGTFVEARHCYGGTRMGDDPATSVVDRYGFAHEAPNLGVVGTSVFPSSGGHNPTLTLQALAWRTAQRLVDGWESIAAAATPRRAKYEV